MQMQTILTVLSQAHLQMHMCGEQTEVICENGYREEGRYL